MKKSYCTLFDSHYIDKGAVTIESFMKYNTTASLYVLCMDDRCREILNEEYNNSQIVTVSLNDFLEQCSNMKQVRETRSPGEFSWSCASSFIKYVLDVFNEECVTYIDADMRFYSDPDKLVDEMLDNKKEVLIVEHRFKENFNGRLMQKFAGRFCVEFNTFLNTEKSRTVLNKWIDDVISSCNSDPESGKPLGDQGYLDEWPNKYECVHITKNVGAGIAPWNIDRYKLIDEKTKEFSFDGKGKYQPVFYHFQGLKYLSDDVVNINIHNYISRLFTDDKFVDAFYIEYLREIEEKKKYLKEKYEIHPIIKTHPAYSKEKSQKNKRHISRNISISKIYEKVRIRISRIFKEKVCVAKDIIDIKALRTK